MNLIYKANDVRNLREYKMLTVIDYRIQNRKRKIDSCLNCKSTNIVTGYDQLVMYRLCICTRIFICNGL